MSKYSLSQSLQIFFALLVAVVIIALPVYAVSSTNVTATVTIQNISVSVSDATIAYGTIGIGETIATTTSSLNDSQTATNDGNVTENINIRSGAEPSGWTIGATAGANIYTHKFCTTSCDSSPTWTALTTSNQTLASSVAILGSQTFDLQFGAPTSTDVFTQQSLQVIVQATI